MAWLLVLGYGWQWKNEVCCLGLVRIVICPVSSRWICRWGTFLTVCLKELPNDDTVEICQTRFLHLTAACHSCPPASYWLCSPRQLLASTPFPFSMGWPLPRQPSLLCQHVHVTLIPSTCTGLTALNFSMCLQSAQTVSQEWQDPLSWSSGNADREGDVYNMPVVGEEDMFLVELQWH